MVGEFTASESCLPGVVHPHPPPPPFTFSHAPLHPRGSLIGLEILKISAMYALSPLAGHEICI